MAVSIVSAVFSGEIAIDCRAAQSQRISEYNVLSIDTRIDDGDADAVTVKDRRSRQQSAQRSSRLRSHVSQASGRFDVTERSQLPVRRNESNLIVRGQCIDGVQRQINHPRV